MAIFYSLCYCLPETVIFETEEVHRKLVGRVSIPTSSCLSSSWIHVGALRFKTSARYLHDLIGTWRSWFVSHTIRICAIYGLPFTINIPQMLAYIPYIRNRKNIRAMASFDGTLPNHKSSLFSSLGIFQHHPIATSNIPFLLGLEVIEKSKHRNIESSRLVAKFWELSFTMGFFVKPNFLLHEGLRGNWSMILGLSCRCFFPVCWRVSYPHHRENA